MLSKIWANWKSKKENWEPLHGDIELIDVGFKYKSGETVMEHMNLKVKAGSSVAIVGPTGAGKVRSLT